ncbi:MAG: hypothetical protein M0C28_01600 [Candidatus Moduliflexus flocculans]|nr:hypothetical protein [Candidatus Moduliflexus flocculans]
MTCDARTGDIRAYLDDMTSPVLTARDKRIGHGLVGVGSFDDTGRLRRPEVTGEVEISRSGVQFKQGGHRNVFFEKRGRVRPLRC